MSVVNGSCIPQTGSNRIAGGQDAQARSWPWQASIGPPGYHTCGGSLISERWVVSAAHCFPKPINSSLYVVRLGVYQLSNTTNINTVITGVKQVIVNLNYDYSVTSSGDIALLELQTRVAYTSSIRPVCLPTATAQFLPGTNCWVTGWGNVQYLANLPPPNTLQELQVPLMNSTSCNSMFLQYLNLSQGSTLIQSDMLCAGYSAGQKSFCNGDSGGPLACSINGTWLLAGVVSWGPKVCASPLAPGVYTRVTSYLSWINNIVPDLDCSATGNTLSSAGIAPAGPSTTATTSVVLSPIRTSAVTITPKALNVSTSVSYSKSLDISSITRALASIVNTVSQPSNSSSSKINISYTISRESNTTNAPISANTTVGTRSITMGLQPTANTTNTTFVSNTTIAATSKWVTQHISNGTATVAPNFTTPLNSNSSTRPLNLNTPSIPLGSTFRIIFPNFTAHTILNSTSDPTSSLILKVSSTTDAHQTPTSMLNISTTDKKGSGPISNITIAPTNFMSTHNLSVLSTHITTNSLAISNPHFNTNTLQNTSSIPLFSNSTTISDFNANVNVTSGVQVSSVHFTTIVSTSSFNVSTTSTSNLFNKKELNSTDVLKFTPVTTSKLVLMTTSNLTRNNSSTTNLSMTTSDLVKIIKATVHQFWSQIIQSLQNTNIWTTEDDLII
ncbi:uncharacterized protein [Pleurodeles waltl]|uniref:uncharacterized protein n=1 Tax=Pleurodeles waltl TaxID=8319 RepID=UPI003709843B